MKSLTTHISNTSELLRDFAWFLDNAEDSHIAEAAELFANYRERADEGLFGAMFSVFALSGKYEDDEERKLRMHLALACYELAKEGSKDQASFLWGALSKSGYGKEQWERTEKKPIWLAWIDAMDELEVLKDAVPDDLRRQSFAQAAALFAKDQPLELIEKVHGELSHQIGIASGRVPEAAAVPGGAS